MSDDTFPFYTPQTLPVHQARILTAQERETMPGWERKADYPGNGFLSLESVDDGRVVVFPERLEGADPMTNIRYYPADDGYEGSRNLEGKQRDEQLRRRMGSELGLLLRKHHWKSSLSCARKAKLWQSFVPASASFA